MATLYVLQDRDGTDGKSDGNGSEGNTGGNVGGAPGVGKNSSDPPSVTTDKPSVSNSTFTTTLEPQGGSTTSSSRSSHDVGPTERSRTHSTVNKQLVMTDSVTTPKPTTVEHGNFLENLKSIYSTKKLAFSVKRLVFINQSEYCTSIRKFSRS